MTELTKEKRAELRRVAGLRHLDGEQMPAIWVLSLLDALDAAELEIERRAYERVQEVLLKPVAESRPPSADEVAGLLGDLRNLGTMARQACGTYELALRDTLDACAGRLEAFIKQGSL